MPTEILLSSVGALSRILPKILDLWNPSFLYGIFIFLKTVNQEPFIRTVLLETPLHLRSPLPLHKTFSQDLHRHVTHTHTHSHIRGVQNRNDLSLLEENWWLLYNLMVLSGKWLKTDCFSTVVFHVAINV